MKKIILLLLICPSLSSNWVNQNTYSMNMKILDSRDDMPFITINYYCIQNIMWMRVYEIARANKLLTFEKVQYKHETGQARVLDCENISKEEWENKYSLRAKNKN